MAIKIFRVLRTVHAWGGITLALLMLVVSVTGSLLVWKQDYLKLVIPEARTHFEPTVAALANIAEAAQAQFKADEIYLLEFPSAEFPLGKLYLTEDRYAYLDSQGSVVAQWTLNGRWEEWLYDLHHRLLLGSLGLTIVGFGAMAMIVLALVGVVSFWPMRRGFGEGVVPHSAAIRHLRSAHRNLGVIEALPLLLTLITGVILVYPEQAQQLMLEPFRGENYGQDFDKQVDKISGGNSGDWQPALQRALDVFPGATIRSAQFPGEFSAALVIGLQQPGELSQQGLSKVYIDARAGFMDLRIDSQAQHVSERLFNTAYPLHSGRFGSLLYKLLLTLSGVAIATLSVLGMWGFIKSWRREIP